MKRGYSCIDSFCGVGGLALGLRRAGFEVLVSFDADECAVETFKRNLSSRCLHAKAEDLAGAKLYG
jgi:DNA (cytosine-5)-methyltransferase 1